MLYIIYVYVSVLFCGKPIEKDVSQIIDNEISIINQPKEDQSLWINMCHSEYLLQLFPFGDFSFR